jgi:hypothetical protein
MDDIETAKQLFFDGLAQLEKNDFVTAERLFTEALAYAPQKRFRAEQSCDHAIAA